MIAGADCARESPSVTSFPQPHASTATVLCDELDGGNLYFWPKAARAASASIQSLIDYKMTVTAHCQNPRCHRHQELDLDMLKSRLGPDSPQWPTTSSQG